MFICCKNSFKRLKEAWDEHFEEYKDLLVVRLLSISVSPID